MTRHGSRDVACTRGVTIPVNMAVKSNLTTRFVRVRQSSCDNIEYCMHEERESRNAVITTHLVNRSPNASTVKIKYS